MKCCQVKEPKQLPVGVRQPPCGLAKLLWRPARYDGFARGLERNKGVQEDGASDGLTGQLSPRHTVWVREMTLTRAASVEAGNNGIDRTQPSPVQRPARELATSVSYLGG